MFLESPTLYRTSSIGSRPFIGFYWLASFLFLGGRTDIRNELWVTRSMDLEIRARSSERQNAVRSASYFFSVVVILAVVFPITHMADFKAASFRKRPIATAWTAMILCSFRQRDVLERLHALTARHVSCRRRPKGVLCSALVWASFFVWEIIWARP